MITAGVTALPIVRVGHVSLKSKVSRTDARDGAFCP